MDKRDVISVYYYVNGNLGMNKTLKDIVHIAICLYYILQYAISLITPSKRSCYGKCQGECASLSCRALNGNGPPVLFCKLPAYNQPESRPLFT